MFSPAFSLTTAASVVLLVNLIAFLGGAHAAPTLVSRSPSLTQRTVKVVASGVPAADCALECGKAFGADKWLLCAVQCSSTGNVEWDSDWASPSSAPATLQTDTPIATTTTKATTNNKPIKPVDTDSLE